ncbi:hypothetical protein RD792_006460 [Penstemon davidsonii]|uniref:Pentatricopeptide repeat-containing protein n=1 Tax=Penstemon davidsonii TaxID=160366 RepID=A0ABR0DD53_9LAMI|nr:hypothetical protein RD792_006460 [Penstemon davidsonii]
MEDLKKIHTQFIKTGLIKDTIAVSRILAFCTTGPARDMNYALQLFNHMEMDERTLFTWNTIIRGFSNSSNPRYAILLFVYMLESLSFEPERRTYPSVFKAYTQLGLAKDGGQVHGRVTKLGLEFDPFIRNSIIHMYVSCGFLDCGMKLFDEDKDSDIVAWNSVVLGPREVWGSGGKLEMENIKASGFTVVSLLNACANLGAFEQGKWVHEYINKNGIELNVIVVTAIIDMYCKCGSVELARKMFEGFAMKGLSCWNSMMLGLATNGFENEPAIIQAKLKKRDSRAGFIEEAVEVIRSMPMNPDAIIWGSLLTACNSHRNVDVAKMGCGKFDFVGS